MRKKITAWLTAVVMVLSLFAGMPVTASASDLSLLYIGDNTEVTLPESGKYTYGDDSGGAGTGADTFAEIPGSATWYLYRDDAATPKYTLTLKGVNIPATSNRTWTALENQYACAIYAGGSLSLELIGENTVTGADNVNRLSCGVYCESPLTISGSGSLEARGGDVSEIYASSFGVYATGTLTIGGSAQVTATGGNSTSGDSYGMAGVPVTIEDSAQVTAVAGTAAGSSIGIHGSIGYITISGGTTLARGSSYAIFAHADASIAADGMSITGSTDAAADIDDLEAAAISSAELPDRIIRMGNDGTGAEAKTVRIVGAEAPRLAGASVWRSAGNAATVRFMSDTAGTCYYQITDSETAPAVGDLSGWTSGGAVSAATVTAVLPDGMTAGAKYVHIVVEDAAENLSDALTVAMPYDIYFFDDFEAYPENTTASSGLLSFTQAHDGSGAVNQKVAAEGENQVFSLSGQSSWASDQYVALPGSLTGIIVLESKIKPVSGTDPAYLRLFNGSQDTAAVLARNGYWQSRVYGTNTSLGVSYTTDTWYAVKLAYDTDTNTFDIWIDGVKANTSPIVGFSSTVYNLYLTAGNGSSTTACFDDVKFYAEPEPPVCAIGTTNYSDLGTALADASSTDTIRLLASINHSSSIVADNRVLNIDLNGFDLTVENVAGHALEAKNNGALNIADEDGNGVLTVNSSGEYKHCVNAVSGGTVNIKGNITASIPIGAPSYQNVIGAYADGAGSSISLTGNTAGHMAGAYSQNGAVITVVGDVSGAYYGALSAYNGSVDITGNVSGSRALVSEYGGIAAVTGDITGSQYAIDTSSNSGWNAPLIRVTGNVTGTGGAAIGASTDADIQITGDVTGHIAVSGSAYACPEVTVDGDVTVGGDFGVSISYGGTVTVEGRILGASLYLMLDNQAVGKDNYELSGDYLKYSNSTTGDPAPFAANTVYVAKPVSPSASAAGITGAATVGQTLTGSYTYHAGSVDAEGDTSFRWLRISGEPSLLGQPYLLYTTNNIAGVESAPGGPPNPTQFTVDGPSHIAKISNYHYGHSHVSGTISLVGADSTVYGPWETVPDGYWSVFPDIAVPAGTYTVVDSQPGSWSFNPQSGNAGMCEIVGYTVISGATEQTYTLQTADAGHSILFEVTPEDADGNRGAAALSTAFGPVTSDTLLNHGTLQFEASSHGTYEGYNGWMIGVTRTGGSDGEVSVSYAMADGTAVAGTNYVAYSGTLTWADGDSSQRDIMFTSYDDSIYSGYLTLTCTLSNPTGGAVLGGQNPVNIQISDNDAPPAPTGLTATAGSGKVTLGWNSVKDAYYQVYCSQTSGSFTEANLAGSVYDGTSYTVTGLTPGHIYYFAVKAGHNIYYSDFSETASAVPTGGTSGGSSPSAPATPTYNADVTAGGGTQTTLPVTVNKDSGTASVDTGSGKLTSDGTVITMPRVPNVNTYSVGIPVPDLSTTGVQGTLTLDTGAGSITVPSNMLTDAVRVDGDKALITIGEGDRSALPNDVKTAIGNRPLIRLILSIDGRQTDWSNPGAPVTVSIPYTPTAAELENPESIIVWYIDGSGNVVTVTNGRYDEMTGMVTFSTTHFSDYAVAYNKVGFNDVASTAWYGKAVSFIAAREITTGTGNGKYSPDAKLTRGEFIVLMMRAYGIAPEANPTDNFADAGDTWYTGYLAAAKRLGISAGVGANMYAPAKEITRQEMFTLLYNTLGVIGQLPEGGSGKTLSDFSDAADIALWAQEAMTLLVETGTISGSGGKLNPTGTTTRAEMAQVLYKLLER